MAVAVPLKNLHLLSRACFGINTELIAKLNSVQPKQLYKTIVQQSSEPPIYLDKVSNSVKGILLGIQTEKQMQDGTLGSEPMNRANRRELTAEQRRYLQNQSREDIKTLSVAWMEEMTESKAQLREKMAFFWHGHFACRVINIYFQQLLLHDIRKHALGNFGDLLRAVSKSASMLNFLNNQQNRKQKPNENFAREVMELFTLGRGNYTEKDIKEAARAFTGWSYDFGGEFVFRKGVHDDGEKTIFNQTGNFDGDDVIDMLLAKKETAQYIAQKIYTFFVNDTPNKEHVQWLAERFFKNKYDIQKLLDDIFTSDWFYAPQNIGCKIKSPVELLIGIRRILPMQIDYPAVQLTLTRAMGQLLFYPPNVAGWPGGKAWIDSSSLIFRMRLPQLIKDDDAIDISVKSDDDVQMGKMTAPESQSFVRKKQAYGRGQQISANVNWEQYAEQFNGVPRENLQAVLESVLLVTPTQKATANVVAANTDASSRLAFIQSTSVACMSTPEYQLC